MDKAIEEAKASVMPFESWERLPGESGLAYSAFCAYRDLGLERNIRKACQFRFAELATEFRQAETPHINSSAEIKLIEKRYRVSFDAA
jgi:hypothetical protein